MPRGPKPKERKIALEHAVASDIRRATRQRDREGHDTLHIAGKEGHCYCLCPRCWVWLGDGRRAGTPGVCICMECPCGGAPWYHEVLAFNQSA